LRRDRERDRLLSDFDGGPSDTETDAGWRNSVILHKRTAYEDFEEAHRKRHLLRLWLIARDFEDGDERLRAGMDAAAIR
jgi:hypothetical protein